MNKEILRKVNFDFGNFCAIFFPSSPYLSLSHSLSSFYEKDLFWLKIYRKVKNFFFASYYMRLCTKFYTIACNYLEEMMNAEFIFRFSFYCLVNMWVISNWIVFKAHKRWNINLRKKNVNTVRGLAKIIHTNNENNVLKCELNWNHLSCCFYFQLCCWFELQKILGTNSHQIAFWMSCSCFNGFKNILNLIAAHINLLIL